MGETRKPHRYVVREPLGKKLLEVPKYNNFNNTNHNSNNSDNLEEKVIMFIEMTYGEIYWQTCFTHV
jgi:hypothetical protein